uniref:Ig-like domain-containing protein n=1 Tax=Chelonoidis abingdonii TaxID=106734 RepID=A0A8C0H419_CHEAB
MHLPSPDSGEPSANVTARELGDCTAGGSAETHLPGVKISSPCGRKDTIWHLPNLGKLTSFEAQHALGNVTVLKKNMEIMIQRSTCRRAQNVPPEMTAFPEDHVELGEPNILICFMDNFSPPVLSLTWLKNGQEVTEGVSKTDFYPCQDNSFCKFSYLPFLPSQSDFYDYQHWGKAGAPEYPAGHMSGSQDSWVLSQLWEGSGAGSQNAWVLSQLWDRSWV